jgi:hypothetical protein
MLLPALQSARLAAKNALCINNLKQNATSIIMFTGDNDSWFPFRNDKNHYSGMRYNNIQKGTSWADAYDDLRWDNPDAVNASVNQGSLVTQLVDYGGIDLPGNPPWGARWHRTSDGRTLGPTFICPGYKNGLERADKMTYFGDTKWGLASANYNNNGASSYDFFFSSIPSWQHASRNQNDPYSRSCEIVKKIGEVWKFGRDINGDGFVTEDSTDLVWLMNSQIMMSDHVTTDGGPGNPVESVHQPRGSGLTYISSRSSFSTFLQFSQNAALQDGSVIHTTGNATNMEANFAYLPGNVYTGTLIPRDSAY